MIKESKWTKAFYIHIQPGDGTRYEFLIARKNKDFLWCASVGSVAFAGYPYRPDSVKDYIKRTEGLSDTESLCQDEDTLDHFIAYISDKAHSNCNPWTARAACLAMEEFLAQEHQRQLIETLEIID